MVIHITAFSGLSPRTHRRLLDANQAQVASGCVMTNGAIRPLYGQKDVYALSGYDKPVVSIYRMNDGTSDFWLGWTRPVSAVKGLIANDTTHRLYFTGDGEPRVTNLELATSAAPYPTNKYVLGVFPPKTAPTVTHSAGSGEAESRAYCYTFVTAWGEESQPSPASSVVNGTVQGTWTISDMDTAPPNSGTVTAAIKDTPSNGFVEVALDSVFGLRAGEEIRFSGVVGMTDLNGTFVLTSVNTSTNRVVVPLATTQTYISGGTWTRVATHNTAGMVKRLYRTVTTASGTQFQFVKEIPVSTTDTIDTTATLGETLPSADWDMPPTNLMALTELFGGALVGVSGNEVCFSEPWRPYAWPKAYRQSMAFEGVAIAVFGNSLVVATSGSPYILTGAHPDSMSIEQINEAWPASSGRSMVSMLAGGMYATPYGLVLAGPGGISVVSKDIYSSREWGDLALETFVASEHDGRYIALHGEGGNRGMLIFDKAERTSHTTANIVASAIYQDKESGRLYMVIDNHVREFDADKSARHVYHWKSKEFLLPRPTNFAAAQVFADFNMTAEEIEAAQNAIAAILAANAALIANEALRGAVGESYLGEFELGGDAAEEIPPAKFDQLQFILYVNDAIRFSKRLTSSEPFRLPAGFLTDNVAVSVTGNVAVSGIALGRTMNDLAASP